MMQQIPLYSPVVVNVLGNQYNRLLVLPEAPAAGKPSAVCCVVKHLKGIACFTQ